MNRLYLTLTVVAPSLLIACPALAQQPAANLGPRITVPSHSNSNLRSDIPPPTFHPRLADGAFGSAPPPACRNGCFSWEKKHGGFHGLGAPRHARDGRTWIVERPFGYAQDREVPPLDYARDERKKEVTPPPPALQCSPVSQTGCALRSPTYEQAQGGAKERKPYVIGSVYASLPPQGCMKMIESGASYYYCSGEWYRQVREGQSAMYKAVQPRL